MMQKYIFLFCFLFLLLLQRSYGHDFSLDLHAEAVLLMNAETGEILFQKNAFKPYYPASLTKVASALYALKIRGDKLDQPVKIEQEAIGFVSKAAMEQSQYTISTHWLVPGASHISLKKGEVVTFGDLLHGCLLASAADASNAIAQYIGGTIPNFMERLNQFLKEIGCEHTCFKNPHGSHHPDHITTAHDMAILTREALKNPLFAQIVKTVRYETKAPNQEKPRVLIQTNRLLKKGKYYYPKAIGVKTGYTSFAQHNLVAAATNKERTLIAVCMKVKEREKVFEDAIKLFDAAFQEPKKEKLLLKKGLQKPRLRIAKANRALKVSTKEDIKISYYPSEEPKAKCVLTGDELTLPIKKGSRVGQLTLQDSLGRFFQTTPLFAQEDVNFHLFHRFLLLIKQSVKWVGVLAAGFCLGVFALSLRKD